MNFKRVLSVFVIVVLFSASSVEAHQIKSDGSMSVLLHSDPNDDPYAGSPAILYFTFTDKNKLFSMEECNCKVMLAPYDDLDQINEKGILTEFNSDTIGRVHGSYSLDYVFPRRDVYAIVVEGEPREGASFEPFRIDFALRIANGEDLPYPTDDSFFYKHHMWMATLTTLFLILIMVVAILMQRRVFKK